MEDRRITIAAVFLAATGLVSPARAEDAQPGPAAPRPGLPVAEVLKRAAAGAPAIRAADARSESAAAVPDEVASYPVPTVGVSVMGWPAAPADGTEIWYKAAETFPLSSVLARRRESAERSADAARADAASARLDMVRFIRVSWAELGAALAEKGLVAEQARALERMADAAQIAYASGAGNGSLADAERARAEALALADDAWEAEARAETARSSIAAAAGLGPGENVADPPPLDLAAFVPAPLPDDRAALSSALGRRPELAGLDARAAAAETDALAADGESVPELMLEAGVRQQINGSMPVAFMVGASIPITWLASGKYDAMKRRSLADAAAARAEKDRTGKAIESDLRALAARCERIARGLESYRAAAAGLEKAGRSAQAAYAAGTADFDTVVDIAMRVVDAKRAIVRRAYESVALAAEADRILARPVEEQIEAAKETP
jgi:outer membrane protein TolC